MTLRELIIEVTKNQALDVYLSNFKILDFEVKINTSYDEDFDFTVEISKLRKQITLERY